MCVLLLNSSLFLLLKRFRRRLLNHMFWKRLSSIETLPDSTWSLVQTWFHSYSRILKRIVRILLKLLEPRRVLNWVRNYRKEESNTDEQLSFSSTFQSTDWSIFLNFLHWKNSWRLKCSTRTNRQAFFLYIAFTHCFNFKVFFNR